MRTSTRISPIAWGVAAALVLGLSGCGSTSDSNAVAHGNKRLANKPKAVADPALREPIDMVAAVSSTKTGPPVQLKFELRERPEIGQPLDVDVALIPDSPTVERVYAKFQPGEGLDLLDGGDLAAVEKPAQSVPIRHTVRLRPKRSGIFTLNVAVGVDSATDSVSRTFAIPVIAGEGLPELAAKSAGAAGQVAPGIASTTH